MLWTKFTVQSVPTMLKYEMHQCLNIYMKEKQENAMNRNVLSNINIEKYWFWAIPSIRIQACVKNVYMKSNINVNNTKHNKIIK